jgi:hypothetical protein
MYDWMFALALIGIAAVAIMAKGRVDRWRTPSQHPPKDSTTT